MKKFLRIPNRGNEVNYFPIDDIVRIILKVVKQGDYLLSVTLHLRNGETVVAMMESYDKLNEALMGLYATDKMIQDQLNEEGDK